MSEEYAGYAAGTVAAHADGPRVPQTSSGGNSWPQFLATADSNRSIALYDFAVGGAATNNSALYFAGQEVSIPDFPQQVATFEDFFSNPDGTAIKSGEATWRPERTLFTVFFGINDIGLEVRNQEDPRAELPQIFGELATTSFLHHRVHHWMSTARGRAQSGVAQNEVFITKLKKSFSMLITSPILSCPATWSRMIVKLYASGGAAAATLPDRGNLELTAPFAPVQRATS